MTHEFGYLNLFLTISMRVIAILNPIGNAAVFLGMTLAVSAREQRRVAVIVGVSVFIILLLSAWIGDPILQFFGISLSAFQIAGAVIIFSRGFQMLYPPLEENDPSNNKLASLDPWSIAIVPLSIPIIAGPASISTVLLYSAEYNSLLDKLLLSVSTLFCAFILWLILRFAPYLAKILGLKGIRIFTRFMGLVLTAIAAQMLIKGLLTAFPLLAQ